MMPRRAAQNAPTELPRGSPATPGASGKGLHSRCGRGVHTSHVRPVRPFWAGAGRSGGPEGLQTLVPSDLSNLSNLVLKSHVCAGARVHMHIRLAQKGRTGWTGRTERASDRNAFRLSDLPAGVGHVGLREHFEPLRLSPAPPRPRPVPRSPVRVRAEPHP